MYIFFPLYQWIIISPKNPLALCVHKHLSHSLSFFIWSSTFAGMTALGFHMTVTNFLFLEKQWIKWQVETMWKVFPAALSWGFSSQEHRGRTQREWNLDLYSPYDQEHIFRWDQIGHSASSAFCTHSQQMMARLIPFYATGIFSYRACYFKLHTATCFATHLHLNKLTVINISDACSVLCQVYAVCFPHFQLSKYAYGGWVP